MLPYGIIRPQWLQIWHFHCGYVDLVAVWNDIYVITYLSLCAYNLSAIEDLVVPFRGINFRCLQFWFYLLRLRRKLLRSSTRMRLLFWIQSGRGLDCSTSLPRGGLDLSQQSPKSAQGGAMEQSSRWWAKICHFGEVGHWSRSLAAFFFRKFLGNLIDAHLRCERRRTFTVRTVSSTITFTQDTQKHR